MNLKKSQKILPALVLLAIFWPSVIYGEMQSGSYKIYADSFNIGGVYSTSSAYALYDSAGEWPGGTPTSTTYEIRAGFQAMERGELAMTISNTSLNLGTLSVSAVNTDSSVISVTSGSLSGYSLSIGSADASPITAVSDGTVTAGSEEYGLAVSGTDVVFGNDRSIISGRVLATSTVAVTSQPTTMTVKASRTATTSYGSKTQNIVLSLSANF
jgi:hypothetical protein